MESMAWILVTLFIIFSITTLLNHLKRNNKKKTNLPPGPKGLPIIGHLHLLGKNPHQRLYELSKKHGPIMFMKFGLVPSIIVSSPEAAEQFLKTHDLVFAGRPPYEGAKITAYGQALTFSPFGPSWRNMRKLCTTHLLSTGKISSFKPTRREEVGIFVESLKHDAQNGVVVDLSQKVASLIANMSCRMIFGKQYADSDLDEKGFKAVISETTHVVGKPNLADFFPYLGILDIGFKRKAKALGKILDTFLERIIKEHEESKEQRQIKDFVDTMLDIIKSGDAHELQITRHHVKAVMMDLLIGSVDSSRTIIEWALSELLRHPQVMKKLQKELEDKVGMNRKVEESDLDDLEYLNIVVKETMRLHPAASFLPRESMEDCTINGYHIPKRSRILVNVYTIGRDQEAWSDPEKFNPERFMASDIDVFGQDFELIPFGSGRRTCPGKQLGLIVVKLVLAQLVHCFSWKLPHGMSPTELDMTEDFGLITSRAKHLMSIPSYRLHE